MFQSALYAAPCGWQLAKNYLWIIILSIQSPEILLSQPPWPPTSGDQRHSLCGLHTSAGFSKAATECRKWGLLAGFRKAMGKYLDCLCLKTSAVQLERDLSVHVLRLYAAVALADFN